MLELFKKSPRFFVGAIIVHVFFLVLFGVGFHFKSKERASTSMPQTVKVTTVDESEVKRELDKLKAQDEREQKRQADLEKKRKAEERRLEELQKKRQADQKKEKERLALLEKKEKELKEKQRKEQQRLEELERKRKAEEQQDRARKEQELKEKMRAEEEKMKREQEVAALRKAELEKRQTTIDKYMNLIEAKVYRNWIKPPSITSGLESELRVKLIPTGDVIDIQLSKSSGDPIYDKSAIAAVKKASPLPLPPAEEGLFDTFRDLRLPMRADKKT